MFSIGPMSLLKAARSRDTTQTSPVALILAALGSSLIRALSPKYPPV